MPHSSCTLLAEIKYRNQPIRLFNKDAAGESSKEVWISFDDISKVVTKNSSRAGPRNELLAAWKETDKVRTFTAKTDVGQEEILCISQTHLNKLIFEAGSSDAFAEWITKSINAEMEKIYTIAAEAPLTKELNTLKQELEKWRGGKQDTVYILNFYPYDDGIYKIGLTDKIERRVADLNTGTPSEIIVEYNRDCGNKRIVEQMMHYVLEKYRVNPNKEFFRIPKHIAISLLDSVVDFIDGMHELMSSRAKGGGVTEGRHDVELMSPKMFTEARAVDAPVIDESGEINKIINSFSVLSINRIRSSILPDLSPIYPKAVPYAHPEPPRGRKGHQKQAGEAQYSYFSGTNDPATPQNDERKHKWFW
jgi:hypothetical protein